MNLVLFGAPGAGKGTQSQLLVARDGFVQISTGDLFREAIKNGSKLGEEIKAILDKGELVPDEITISILRAALKNAGSNKIIFDGFPRTISQASSLDKLLKEMGQIVDLAVFIDVDEKTLLGRLADRRVCRQCASVYSATKVKDDVCRKCGGEIYQREDDKAEVVANRLQTYKKNTVPLEGFYADKGNFVKILGDSGPEEVYQEVKRIVMESVK